MHLEGISSPNRPVLVTGGLGFIGGHLVDHLIDSGFKHVRVFDNHRRAVTPTRGWPSKLVEVIQGDVRDQSGLHNAMKGCELVYHLAAQSNVLAAVSDPYYSYTTNVGGTWNVLFAAREEQVRRVVFTSSREVYGDRDLVPVSENVPLNPKNLYGATKAASEIDCRALEDDDLEVVILRLANVYGPRDQDRVIPIFLRNALQDDPLTVYGGEQILDFVWIDTVVTALLTAGHGDYVSEPINVGSGVGTTVLSLARKVLQLIHSNSRCLRMPTRALEVSKFVADIDRAKTLLGLPSVSDPLAYLPQLIDCTRHQTLVA